MQIYTIGHSDHSIEAFIELLHQHGITLLADVRSQPYSRWTPQFNREELAPALQKAGIAYQSMGDNLGGRPADRALYDPGEERPNYERLAETSTYQAGLARLLDLARGAQVAIMCSEGDFHHCHRHLLITQTLLARGVEVRHIQPDGATVAGEIIPKQLGLF
ncbi:MAG TPA: DUF488 domain-containing protein [Anaerolineae bacterium]|nr:DUF488 domain-containing protein [Anaerolineae bacterium]